ncbi:MAG: D-tyrosyl-tRNA(Tyr) deacylase [Leptospirales bacterium]|nr:D-tyrosyl-tRNA(Tyr) deacylase [Leptospirales bacterium]
MRAVVQRARSASVSVAGEVVGSIGHGLLVFVGIQPEDDAEDVEWLAQKIASSRLFDDANGLPNLPIRDVNGGFLVVSQFTLFASTRKGNRPSFSRAARPEFAIPLYESFVTRLRALSGCQVETGRFGANMQVSLINDGPITILFDTKVRE